MGSQKPGSKATKPPRPSSKGATLRDESCGPAEDDSGITNVGGSASGRREPHGCTHLRKSESRKQKEKPAR